MEKCICYQEVILFLPTSFVVFNNFAMWLLTLTDKKDGLFYWEAQSFIHYALTHRIPEFIK